jgi:tRNA dimethylallyltransferase
MAKNIIVILGPTASGKTALAVQLAYELGGEIISADSRQVYRGMDLGTGKDLNQYVIHGKKINYHLIDVVDPREEFNLFDFQKIFYEIFINLRQKNILPIMVGGTGLYLEAVLASYNLPFAPRDESLRNELFTKTKQELQEMLLSFKHNVHNKTDLEDQERLIRAIEIEVARNISANKTYKPDIDAVVFGIRWERQILRQRITDRLKERLNQGMVEEVKSLNERGIPWPRLESFGLEYRFISMYLQNKINYKEMTQKLNTSIHQFAKRQETWFRRMEKKNININWINGDDFDTLRKYVAKYLK